ncbi:hypothetical protein ACVK1X_004716 [Pseudomonas sp. PvR086]|jgi:hypothetical protein|uniref:hypothetical protein n=1 Tax=Pseudomonas TaxID=286 RepID=UPI0007E463E6|nr:MULTISPECIES: hypothetical protein [Pseudomonas]MBD9609020.1 hypothetical protein [Pseudomonas sp. PDM08]MDR7107906.1 hypothetical protein [Pseudomonas frederiksbergensis]PMY49714.1 hypothetical protein C1X70_21760 [Pseudomonas sp. FW305-53]PMY88521.1 hypothetical protein C1X68_02125 [Pseudomonas sp. FW303-C2]PMY90619.1 hypothetical protein C1X67_23060 [Pseudomonas sp. FW305-62]
MDETKLFASVLTQINENQLALGAAIEELSNWIAQRGATEIADNIRCALQAIDRNQEFISLALISISTDFKESQAPKKHDPND